MIMHAAALRLVPGYVEARCLYIEGVLSLCWPPSQKMPDELEILLLSWHQICSGEGVPFLSHILIISPLSILPHRDSTVSSQLGRSISNKSSNTISEPGVNPRYISHSPYKAGLTSVSGCLLHGSLSGLQLKDPVLESGLPNLSESFSGSQIFGYFF